MRMLYTVLPGLTLCMTLLNGTSNNDPIVNVAVDSDRLNNNYMTYLDAAMILLKAAKLERLKNERSVNEETNTENSTPDENFETPKTDARNDGDFSPDSNKTDFQCPSKPIDCEELLLECGFTTSGVYHIWPRSRIDTGGNVGFDVYCDMDTDGGGWTVFQRRDDFGTNSDFFYKDWLYYKFGFGHLNFDFWLGNDKIFALSNQRQSLLRIDLVDFADEEGYATYDNFYIDDEKEGYRLHIGDYRGNIGDSFSGHNLCKFSTRDRDNDKSTAKHCARMFKGGWWYNDCHTVNLNGLYLKGTHGTYADGVNWHGWRGFRYSLKKTEMKLRSSLFRPFVKSVNSLPKEPEQQAFE